MSGKTRPDTGCVLVSEPRVDRVGKARVLTAELVTSDGYVATTSFETPWFLQLGNYYDVEVRAKKEATAPSSSKTPPQGTSSSASWLSDNIFGISAATAPTARPRTSVLRDERDRSVDGGRLLGTGHGAEGERGGPAPRLREGDGHEVEDVVILVAGTTASRWKKENGEKTSRAVVDSRACLPRRT